MGSVCDYRLICSCISFSQRQAKETKYSIVSWIHLQCHNVSRT